MTAQPETDARDGAPSTEMDTRPPDMARGALHGESLSARIRYAKEIASADDMLPRGLIDNRTGHINPGKVLLLVEFGQMLGIHPIAALNGVHVIEGKPSISPALMTALVRRAGHRVRVRVEGALEDGTLSATCTVVRNDDPQHPFSATWTLDDAQRAELGKLATDEKGKTYFRARSKSGNALSWEKYTRAMLKARSIGEACREAAEEALCGVHYTPEELGAEVDEEGEVTLLPQAPPAYVNDGRPRNSQPQPQVQAPPDSLTIGRAMTSATSMTQLNERLASFGLAFPPDKNPTGKWAYNKPALLEIDVSDDDGVVLTGWQVLGVVGPALLAKETKTDDVVDAEVVEDPPVTGKVTRQGPDEGKPDAWTTPAPDADAEAEKDFVEGRGWDSTAGSEDAS